jgi:transcriptional regulator with XRE-family HTH domain
MQRRAMPKKLGKKLLQIRLSLGLSQRQLVEALNYKDTPLRASQISQYENGQREPTMMLVLAYARLAKVPMETLVDDKIKWPAQK